MKDSNWDLISGQDAHDIEILNYANQVNVIEALFKFTMFYHKDADGACAGYPNTKALRELHRTGTLFLLSEPGEYRKGEVSVVNNGGQVVYQPPPASEVEHHMSAFEFDLQNRWKNNTPIQLAAFCLWKLNWIHPFKNGNGRTARAFSYACLCLRYGFILPGAPTVIDLIMANRDPYNLALNHADASFVDDADPDLQKMERYLEELLTQQLSSIP